MGLVSAWRLASCFFACVVLLAAGCGPSASLVKPKGKIVKTGEPLHISIAGLPPGDRGFRVGFVRIEDGKPGEVYYAKVDTATATFEVTGPENKGIPPGKYRITLHLGAVGKDDELKGQFTAETSPIERDIQGNDEIIIDLEKPQG